MKSAKHYFIKHIDLVSAISWKYTRQRDRDEGKQNAMSHAWRIFKRRYVRMQRNKHGNATGEQIKKLVSSCAYHGSTMVSVMGATRPRGYVDVLDRGASYLADVMPNPTSDCRRWESEDAEKYVETLPDDCQSLARLLLIGMTRPEIAEKDGCCTSTVDNRIRDLGTKIIVHNLSR